jgi:hypothetical protein
MCARWWTAQKAKMRRNHIGLVISSNLTKRIALQGAMLIAGCWGTPWAHYIFGVLF